MKENGLYSSSLQKKMSVHHLFARKAAAHPNAIAIKSSTGEFTYAELDFRANQLAHQLGKLGIDTECPVGVCLERSAQLIIALLGVLKAGGCYLALDSTLPIERRAAMLREANVKVVIVKDSASVPGDEPTTALIFDESSIFARLPATVQPAAALSNATAYIAYTSGSTGQPKGISVPHRAIARLVVDADFLQIRPEDVFLQFAPVAFDASTLEIWGPLLNGARLVIAPPGDLSPRELTSLVKKERVTVLWLTAGLFHAIVESGVEDLRGLRCLLAGGDVLSAAHVKLALCALPDTILINGYGPTENTTFTTCHILTNTFGEGTVPIGRPIRGTAVHLLDRELVPVADGEMGELYASGAGLAHGYVNSPSLTADRFVPNPFSNVPGERMYRTGDLAMRRPDGAVAFCGRADEQVKIRGFRIEPGEIEAALRRHSEIADAAVVGLGRPGVDRHLAAFYVSQEVITSAELRSHLGTTLPSYMLPAFFVRLDALPLNTNGKVDRALLTSATRPARPDVSTTYRAPRTALEEWLVELWADMLEIAEVGVDDDFFELGGHSLMAARITGTIGAEHDVALRAVAFYENPTIAELSVLITGMRIGGGNSRPADAQTENVEQQ